MTKLKMDFGAKKRDLGKHKSKAFFFFFCSVKTDLLKDGAISRLYIAFASKRDTGNYTCSMRNAQASVFVHILDGKYWLIGLILLNLSVWSGIQRGCDFTFHNLQK